MKPVPKMLRLFFIIHFFVDISVAIPLFIWPEAVLSLIGRNCFDPFAARMIAAALFGIGIESLLSRNASAESYKSMLGLKIIWSSMAIAGMILTMIQYPGFRLLSTALFLAIFVVFNVIWTFWALRLKKIQAA